MKNSSLRSNQEIFIDNLLARFTEKEWINIFNTRPSVLISHSSIDGEVATAFVDFFSSLGIPSNQVLCSSNPDHAFVESSSFMQPIRRAIINGCFVVFILSNAFFESIPCQIEIGATWVLKNPYSLVCLKSEILRTKSMFQTPLDPMTPAILIDSDVSTIASQCKGLAKRLKEYFFELGNPIPDSTEGDYFTLANKLSKVHSATLC